MRISLYIVVAFIGYGCAAKKLAIDNADTLISHQIQKRLHLESVQKKELRKDVVEFLNNSKPTVKNMIPVLAGITLENNSSIDDQYKKLEDFYRKIAGSFSALFSKHMAKLSSKQEEAFLENLREENKELTKKDRKKKAHDIEERLEMFLGKLEDEQKIILTQYEDYFVQSTEARILRRKKLQKEFEKIFDQDIEKKNKEELFQKAFLSYQDETIKFSKNEEILHKLLPTITDAQRKHFKTKAKEVIDLIEYYLKIDY